MSTEIVQTDNGFKVLVKLRDGKEMISVVYSTFMDAYRIAVRFQSNNKDVIPYHSVWCDQRRF